MQEAGGAGSWLIVQGSQTLHERFGFRLWFGKAFYRSRQKKTNKVATTASNHGSRRSETRNAKHRMMYSKQKYAIPCSVLKSVATTWIVHLPPTLQTRSVVITVAQRQSNSWITFTAFSTMVTLSVRRGKACQSDKESHYISMNHVMTFSLRHR